MVKPVQEEFFSPEQFTRICSRCRRELPRTRSFFPEGRSNDGMSSVCRQCTQFKLPQSRKPSPEDFQHQERNVKPCSDCGLIKPLNEFFMDSQTVDGKARSCKSCSTSDFRQRSKDANVSELKHGRYSSFRTAETSGLKSEAVLILTKVLMPCSRHPQSI